MLVVMGMLKMHLTVVILKKDVAAGDEGRYMS